MMGLKTGQAILDMESNPNTGYATEGLKMMISIAKDIIEEDEIYMSVRKENRASLKVQLNNGAYIHHEDDKEYYTRIKIRKEEK